MEDRDYIKKEEKRLIDFCHNHKQVYIYGAGNYGRGYLDVLRHNHIDVAGFIVTDPVAGECCGLRIYAVEEAAGFITEQDGVIPAFTNSVPEEIRRNFAKAKPDILSFDHKVMLCLDVKLCFFPIMDKMDAMGRAPGLLTEKESWRELLIVRLDAIGDTVFTTAFIRELKQNFPTAALSIVIRKQNYFLLKNCPYIDRLFLYESELRDGELSDQCQDFEALCNRISNFAQEKFDGIDFDAVFFPRELLCGRNTIDELLLGFYSKAACRIGRIMSNELDKRFIYERVQKSFSLLSYQTEAMHEAAYALSMLRDCGCKVEKEEMELWPDKGCQYFAKKILEENGVGPDTILVALGLVASVETRTWRIENYRELIRSCHKKYGDKMKFLLMGGQDAVAAADELNEDLEVIINMAGKTQLDQTAACMQSCDLYVGSNTGLLHFASAFGKPSVTIYSELSDGKPTDGDSPFRMGAWKVENVALIPPAGLDGCHGVCRMRRSHCINQITPLQVEQAMATLLESCKGKRLADNG